MPMPFAPGEDRPYPGRGMWGEGALHVGMEGRSLVLVVIRGEGTRCVLPQAGRPAGGCGGFVARLPVCLGGYARHVLQRQPRRGN